jgi:predicted permease
VTPAEIFGVEVGHQYDVAIPICADRLLATDGKGRAPVAWSWWIAAMGRLKPGWTLERAQAHIQALAPVVMEGSLPPTYRPDDAKKYLANKLVAKSGATGVSNLREDYEQPLWLLFATTGLVLLIACANLANLLLARGSVREREIAVRQAIGASRGRLIAQLLTESLLLSVLGAALGLLLAQTLSQALAAFLNTPDDPTFLMLSQDLRVFGFTTAVAVLTCILFGLTPALRATRVQPASAMRAGGRGLTAGRERFSLRRTLVVAQVAMSMVLLVGALLFVRSLQKLLLADVGFRPDGAVTVSLDLSRTHFAKERIPVVHRELLDRLRALPGVTDAGEVYIVPVGGNGWNGTVYPESQSGSPKVSDFNRTGPGYFRLMGTPFVTGRDFDERDTVNSPPVAIVSEAFARKFFNGANPVGRTFHRVGNAGKGDDPFLIVGMVRDTKYYQIREDFHAIAYLPVVQDAEPDADMTLMLRTRAPAGELLRGVNRVAASVNPEIGIDVRAMTSQLKDSLLRDRLMASLAGAFGILAAILAMMGLYGVIAYMVTRRKNEIGVRIALGADRPRVVGLVLREAVVLLAAGLVIGVGLAAWAAQAAATLLFGLKPHDPATLASAAALLVVTALMAAYGPARRSARVEPMQALREE